jgi:hypothetical protein
MGVKKAILNNFTEQDLVIVREYLLDIDYKSMSIYQAIKEANTYKDAKIKLLRKEETENLNAQEYKDFNIKDFL